LTSLQVAELIGAQRPAWSHLPSEVSSSAGAEAIDLARAAGLILDDWQSWVLDKSLGENDAGSWSAFEVALLVGRQNGKNAILEARELAGIVLFGDDLIVHTAHRADTTMEHFRRMEQYAEEFDEFRRLVKRVSRKNGDESIELKGGRRIKFVCRARNPGRGFSGSCIVFDEALASLDGGVIGAMIPTLATRSMAQVWYTSSAPRSDSTFLHDVCRRGRAGDGEPRMFYAEWGNEPDVDFDDWEAIARANPGLGVRISRQFVEDERRLMSATPAEFARERLGIPEAPSVPVAQSRRGRLAVPHGRRFPPGGWHGAPGARGVARPGVLHVRNRWQACGQSRPRVDPPSRAGHVVGGWPGEGVDGRSRLSVDDCVWFAGCRFHPRPGVGWCAGGRHVACRVRWRVSAVRRRRERL
jgi:hypothetical protein